MNESHIHETITDHRQTDTVTLPKPEELEAAARFLRTIGDPTKLRIVCALAGVENDAEREICAGAIAASLGMTKSAVSHQLRILREEGLVKCRREGKHVIYALDDDHVYAAVRMTLEHIRHRGKNDGSEKQEKGR